MPAKFNTLYSHPKSKTFEFTQASLTKQSFGYETDINNIVKRGVQSALPPNNNQPIFGSTFKPNQYTEALNVVAKAKSDFEALPSHIRQEFDNNPEKLLKFCSDEKNYDRAVELGLAVKKIDTPIKSEIVNKTPAEVITDPVQPVITEASSQ